MHVVVFQQVRIIQQGWLNRNSLKTREARHSKCCAIEVVSFNVRLYVRCIQMHVSQLAVSKGN